MFKKARKRIGSQTLVGRPCGISVQTVAKDRYIPFISSRDLGMLNKPMRVWVVVLSALMSLATLTTTFAGTAHPPSQPCGPPCCLRIKLSVGPDGPVFQRLFRCRLLTMDCSVKCMGVCSFIQEATNPCPGESTQNFGCPDYQCSKSTVCRYDMTKGLSVSSDCTGPSTDNCSQYSVQTGCVDLARVACEALGYAQCGSVYTVTCPFTGNSGGH